MLAIPTLGLSGFPISAYICIAYVASISLDEAIKTQLELSRLLMIMVPNDRKQTIHHSNKPWWKCMQAGGGWIRKIGDNLSIAVHD